MNSATGTSAPSSIIPFTYQSKKIRTIQNPDDSIWFVTKDVCIVLGISKYRDAMSRLDDDEKSTCPLKLDGWSQARSISIISESGLYTLILRSNKPEAKPFRKWVTSEVLPTIRKTGSYDINQTPHSLDQHEDLSIGERIMLLRKRKNLTRKTLGHRVYIEKKIYPFLHPNIRISKVEKNIIHPSNYLDGELKAIAEVLDVSVDCFLENKNDRNTSHDASSLDGEVSKFFPKLSKYIEAIKITSSIDTNLCHYTANRLDEYVKSYPIANDNPNPISKTKTAKTLIKTDPEPLRLRSRALPKHVYIPRIAGQLSKHLLRSSNEQIKRFSALCKNFIQMDPRNKKERLSQAYLAVRLKVSRQTIHQDLKPLVRNDLIISYKGYLPKDDFFLLVNYLRTLPQDHVHKSLETILF